MSIANPAKEAPGHFTSIYPVVAVEVPATTAKEFQQLFELGTVYETDWYVHLKSADGQKQIGLIQSGHEIMPVCHRGKVHGTLVTIESNDSKAVCVQAKDEVKILHPLADEAWGQRDFNAELSGGVLVDVVQLLPRD